MDMKKQLMQMAGITNVAEFDEMAAKVAQSGQKLVMGNKEEQEKRKQSPFQGMAIYIQIMSIL